MAIRFGTSGWRAVMADEFTFANVRRVTRAICDHLRTTSHPGQELIIVGYDTRFLGEHFAEECVKVLSEGGFKALLCDRPTPTPTISHAIRNRGAIGAINFTASHNPPEYNGMKFSTADGAPALPEATRHVEELIAAGVGEEAGGTATSDGLGAFESYDPRPTYVADLETKVRFDVIAQAGGRYAYDPLWGTGRGYLDDTLRAHGVEVETIHDWRE